MVHTAYFYERKKGNMHEILHKIIGRSRNYRLSFGTIELTGQDSVQMSILSEVFGSEQKKYKILQLYASDLK